MFFRKPFSMNIFLIETDIKIEVFMRKIERNINPVINQEEREVLIRRRNGEK